MKIKLARTKDQQHVQRVAYEHGLKFGEHDARRKVKSKSLWADLENLPKDSYQYAYAAGYVKAWERWTNNPGARIERLPSGNYALWVGDRKAMDEESFMVVDQVLTSLKDPTSPRPVGECREVAERIAKS